MTHYMNLDSLPFEQIKSRAKNKGKTSKRLGGEEIRSEHSKKI